MQNSHSRRLTGVECSYEEFLSWLVFMQHLRHGTLMKDRDIVQLSRKFGTFDLESLASDIRFMQKKMEHFRGITLGFYQAPGTEVVQVPYASALNWLEMRLQKFGIFLESREERKIMLDSLVDAAVRGIPRRGRTAAAATARCGGGRGHRDGD